MRKKIKDFKKKERKQERKKAGKKERTLRKSNKCKKRNLAIYLFVLTTSRLVSNAYLKGIMMKIKIVLTP